MTSPTYDKALLKLLIELSLDSDLRHRFDDPAQREQIMQDYRLSDPSKQAIVDSNRRSLTKLGCNTQVASTSPGTTTGRKKKGGARKKVALRPKKAKSRK